MNILTDIWTELNTPDNYANNWYGYATNQVTHLAMGFAAACLLSNFYFYVFGEFAEKGALWFVLALIYAVYELSAQGWNGKDTIEDWFFFSVYGAGVPIMIFSETEIGSPIVSVNTQMVVPVLGVVIAHLIGGVAARIYLKVRADRD